MAGLVSAGMAGSAAGPECIMRAARGKAVAEPGTEGQVARVVNMHGGI